MTTDRQTYQIELTGYIKNTDQDPPYEETQTFKITVNNDCPNDKLTLITDSGENTFPDNVSGYTYYIGEHTDKFIYDGRAAF